MDKPRLHQFLSKTGVFKSKKELVFAVKNSEIMVNDKIITNLHYQFNPNKNKVYYKEKELQAVGRKVYVIVNKPAGYLSSRLTSNDQKLGKKSIFSLFDKDKSLDGQTRKTLFCVGRLDETTSGLIIITNDGALGSLITRPESNITKTYRAVLEKPIDSVAAKEIEKGVVIKLEENGVISEYKTKPCKITLLDNNTANNNKNNDTAATTATAATATAAARNNNNVRNKVIIEVIEGKKREVRRIFEAVRNKVKELKRISIGKIRLDELGIKEGGYLFVDNEYISGMI